METVSFWKGIKPFKATEKGSEGINYGYQQKHYKRGEKCDKRKAYRQIRKYGFDLSECWSLDYTIQRWLSDNVQGFFRICGTSDSWSDVTLEGEEYDFEIHKDDIDWGKNVCLYENTRCKSFKNHLRDFLDNPPDLCTYDAFRDFVIPRLRQLAKMVHGWPVSDDFPNWESWVKEINNMADKLEEGTYSEYFITYFFNLWD